MRKRISGKKFSMDRDSRIALYRSLVRSLVKYGSIKTTRRKAKSVQPFIDKYVKLAKKGSVSARRQLYADLGNDRGATDTIIQIVKANFSLRNAGFTKIINLPRRRGDSSPLVRLEWVEEIDIYRKESDKKKKKTEVTKKETDESKGRKTIRAALGKVRAKKHSDSKTGSKTKGK